MEALEIVEFPTKWKMFWFVPEELKCNICDKGLAEVAFGRTDPAYPTRCRTCAKDLVQGLSESNKAIGLKGLAELP